MSISVYKIRIGVLLGKIWTERKMNRGEKETRLFELPHTHFMLFFLFDLLAK